VLPAPPGCIPCRTRDGSPQAARLPWANRTMSSQPRRRHLEVETQGDVTLVRFTDRNILNEDTIQTIGEQLFTLVDQGGRRQLVLDFGNVEFLSSAALGKFIILNKKLNALGGKLVFRNVQPQVYEGLEIVGLHEVFKIEQS
jgi:anti-sigma B factor antagonist